jgi:hypothetical protein
MTTRKKTDRPIVALEGAFEAGIGCAERGRRLREEIAFLRSFGLSDTHIAQRFGVQVNSLHRQFTRNREGDNGRQNCAEHYRSA